MSAPWPTTVQDPRSISFTELLKKVYRALQIDPATGPSTPRVQGQIDEAINSAYRHAWQGYAWPESMPYAELDVAPHPVTLTPFVPRSYLLNSFATVFGFWTAHPLADPNCARVVNAGLDTAGYFLPKDYASATVWAHYRPDPPEFSNVPYSADTTYSAGDTVRFTDGHCYQFIGATPLTGTAPTSGTPPVVDVNWQRLVVLKILAEMTKMGAAALVNVGKEKYASASVLADAMNFAIGEEILLITNQIGVRSKYRNK